MLKPAMVKKKYEVGVVVGRFQVHRLHDVHSILLSEVVSKHEKVLVFLGVSSVLGSGRDPLDFESRKRMLQERFPTITVLPIKDMASDLRWSRELDKKIKEVCPLEKVVLYGGRDSFIKNYDGRFEVCEFEQNGSFSGTEMRKQAACEVRNSDDWRAGVIYGVSNQYKKAIMCVDIALLRDNRKEIVLGRKPEEDKYRFFGGHVDPTDKSLECAAKRELNEEAGQNVEVSRLGYVESFLVDDWRYRNNCDKIMTALFVADYLFGNIEPGDDINEAKRFHVEDFTNEAYLVDNLAEEHFPLMKGLISFLGKEKCQCKDIKG